MSALAHYRLTDIQPSRGLAQVGKQSGCFPSHGVKISRVAKKRQGTVSARFGEVVFMHCLRSAAVSAAARSITPKPMKFCALFWQSWLLRVGHPRSVVLAPGITVNSGISTHRCDLWRHQGMISSSVFLHWLEAASELQAVNSFPETKTDQRDCYRRRKVIVPAI